MTLVDYLWAPLGHSLIIAATLTLLILIRSIYAFSQTGPQIRGEIIHHYTGYSAYALGRLAAWTFLVLAWMAMLGTIAYNAGVSALGSRPTTAGFLVAGLLGITIVAGTQFLYQLVQIPSSIMMSSHYSMRHFHALWKHLSVSRIRWLRVAVTLAFGAPLVSALVHHSTAGEWMPVFVLLGIPAVLLIPVAVTIWPPSVPALTPAVHAEADDRPPNILMIGSDTLRADRVGCFGHARATTPFLDALARRSTAFSHCYTPIARTAPSLASLLSGAWPHAHGIRSNFVANDQTRLSLPALPELFARAGYRTCAISDWSGADLGKFHFGFQETELPEDQWNLKYLIRQGPKDIRLFLSLFTHNRLGRLLLPEIYYLAGVPLTRHLGLRARQKISHYATSGEPFFLCLFMGTTHPPFGSEHPYYLTFADAQYDGESKFGMARLTDPFEVIRSQRQPREAFDLDQINDLYDGCVRNFDDEVRKIYHHLIRCGLERNTIIVIFSDHGMELFEHNTWGQGNSAVGDASPRVPLIVHDPRRPGTGVNRKITRTIDLPPTLLELCGMAPPGGIDGVSLVPYMESGQADLDLKAFFETGLWLTRPPGQHPDHICYPELLDLLDVPDPASGTLGIKQEYRQIIVDARDRMVRTEKWKLLYLPMSDGPRYVLYDLTHDPGCERDVAGEHPEVLASLRQVLLDWIEAASPSKRG